MLLVASPVIAFSDTGFKHTTEYRIGGIVNISSATGQAFRTGAVRTQTIRGTGDVTKSQETKIAPYIMRIDDTTNWNTYVDAVRNLAVTTTINLSALPMSAAAHAYDTGTHTVQVGDILNPYHPPVIDGRILVTPLTRQIWHVQVKVERGHRGTYDTSFVAAYGPGPFQAGTPEYKPEYSWWIEDDNGIRRIAYGDKYVGNYFWIEQYINTSGGETKRLIDISSAIHRTYYMENLHVSGSLMIREMFTMLNISHGPDAITFHWTDLF